VPIRDQAAMNRSLDNDYGSTRGPNSPAAFEVALFSGDPTLGGVEIAGSGYARGALNNATGWLAAADGLKATVAPVAFPATTAAWSTVTHWGLYDAVSATWWEYARLVEPLEVTTAGPGPTVALAIFYDNNPS
jgi:hypothetical protein